TGAIVGNGSEAVGFAGRVAVNPGVLADPSKLVIFAPGGAIGEPTTAHFIYNQLTTTTATFSPQTGPGNAASPYSGSLPGYMRHILSLQGEAAANASSCA